MSVAVREKIERDRAESVRTARRPRVLHLINSFEIGGTERQAVELLKRLDPKRFDVRLGALRKEGPFYEEVRSRFAEVPEFPLTSFYNLNALRQLLRLRRLMKRERIEILHAHDFYSGLIGSVAARLAGVRVIACQRHLKLSDRRVHRWGQRVIQRLAHRILVNSEAIRDYIITRDRAAARKIVVVKNGISPRAGATEHGVGEEVRRQAHDELCRELGIDLGAMLVGVTARLQPVKGHRYLIEAAAQVVRINPGAHFVLVGDGPLRGEIENQIAQLGITENVHLLGDRKDAPRLAAAFDLVVLASLHEGLPNAVMEAMAAGVPVVATAVGGTKELIADGETGFLVPAGDASALASRIAFALSNRAKSIEMAGGAYEFVMDRFGVNRMVESVESLYDEVIED
jgi:glycosyltransferase involved in cell wall biosynthesis